MALRLRPRLPRAVGRLLMFALRVVVVGLAMGVAPPSLVAKMLRHDDPVVQVEEEKEP